MFSSDRILALDIGSSKLALAEFSAKGSRPPELINFCIQSLGIDFESESDPSAYIVSTLREMMHETGIRPAPLLMSLSGQAVFPRYVKLPPVGRDKIQQMIQYEAEQNVPFPIAEVVWDYQLIGDPEAGEQNVMLVAVKTENVTELTECVLAAGLEPDIVDVAPMTLYNCVRFNYPDLDGCTMVLDIGARSTNLLFIESNRIFTRNIPVAGNTITQELAKSFQIGFQEAERLKLEKATVSLGGVYAAGDDEVSERVGKVVRNVLTRLHAEVNRSINFYRSQQNGTPPVRVLLTGGGAAIPNMDTFFRDKLQAEVDFLNPFVTVPVSSKIDVDGMSDKLFLLGETVGLALRRSMSCPVEINLMPPALVEQKIFRRRLPFFGLTAVGVVLAMVTWSFHAAQMRKIYENQQKVVERNVERLEVVSKDLSRTLGRQRELEQDLEALGALALRRSAWPKAIEALRDCLWPGMWLREIAPLRDERGRIARLRVSGRGFQDRLDAVVAGATSDRSRMTAVEMLRDRLDARPEFDATRIVNDRQSEDVFLREFVLEIGLANPIERM